MIQIIILLIISFFTGVFVKLVDLIEDNNLKLFRFDNYLFALMYGILIGFIISHYELIAPLWIGTIFANIAAKKVDKKSHISALLIALLFIFYFGFGNINITFLIIFTFAALIDEILGDFAAGKPVLKIPFLKKPKKMKINKTVKNILLFRPFLEISALIISIITGFYSIFLAIFLFDIGYIFINKKMTKTR